jgi:hypothetical protein
VEEEVLVGRQSRQNCLEVVAAVVGHHRLVVQAR